MTEAPIPNRRRFQFSLRTLLIGVTLLAVGCWYAAQAKIVRDRETWKNRSIQSSSWLRPRHVVKGNPDEGPSLIRRWLGDYSRTSVLVLYPEDQAEARRLFPE